MALYYMFKGGLLTFVGVMTLCQDQLSLPGVGRAEG